jgi:chloramphenicol O-acetyltransferase type A
MNALTYRIVSKEFMPMNRKEIDLETWSRKSHYEHFIHMDYPHFSVTADLDVTLLVAFTKQNKLSFFKTVLYLTTRLANEFEPFRLRNIDGHVYLYDVVHPSFTYLLREDLYSYVSVSYQSNFRQFVADIDTYIETHQGEIDIQDRKDINEFLFITSLPWLKFNDIQHPIGMHPVDSIPRICWGKYEEDFKGRFMMPLSVQVNHAIMDGLHLSQYFLKLESMFKSPESWLNL